MDFRNKRVTVMGLGSFGGQIAAIHFLANEGAREIIVTDSKPADTLTESLAQIADVPNVTLRLGGHDERDFAAGVDCVIVSPAVPKSAPMLAVARQAGVPLTSEMNLFFARCPARIVGITGSAGKSTTTAMIEAALTRGLGESAVHLGGNIGHRALLPQVHTIKPADIVVLELSSFQLEDLGELRRSPQIAVVTNITPNHLDRHGTMEEYVRCKQNILRFQTPGDTAILNAEDPALTSDAQRAGPSPAPERWDALTPGCVIWYRAEDAASVKLKVVGRHNRLNAAATLAVGRVLGVPEAAMAAALADFSALPHRLELVGESHGVRWFNDSKATTPESTLTALDAFTEEKSPMIVIVGGYDKKLKIGSLCGELARRAKAVIAIGQTGPKFADLVRTHRPSGAATGIVQVAGELKAAVRIAASFAAPGDVVLLSPAAASWGQFKNYEERGEQFRQLVKALT
ncbi:MAG: UDP-N-acetylmuramoyl-L-alanine--D-glutamate ligase [Phycisphaerae bacterium]|nr:UDP-N-acetylmuramoyl-L-alanine--D-glutamate ligase [Phycisphaerae bacterium]